MRQIIQHISESYRNHNCGKSSGSLLMIISAIIIHSMVCISDVQAQYDNYPYAIIELEGLGGSYTKPFAINEKGWITGECNIDWRYHAGLWNKSTLEVYDLGSLDGDNSVGYDINDRGQVAGHYTPLGHSFLDPHAMYWEKGVMIDLGTLEDGIDSESWAINNSGQVVGYSDRFGEGNFVAFSWDKDNGMVNLGGLDLDSWSKAYDINELGYAVGNSTYYDGQNHPHNAVIWTAPNELIDLGTLGGPSSEAFGINDFNQVVGRADTNSDTHAFYWDKGIMYDIHKDIMDMEDSGASAINNYSQVVGFMSTYYNSDFKPFFWQPGQDMILLTYLLPPKLNHWDLEGAKDINDMGQIVGYAQRTNEFSNLSPYLMTPVYPSFDLEMAVPGVAGVVNTMTASNLQPGAKVHFVYNRHGGGAVIPGCDVTINALQIENPKLAGYAVADADGIAVLEGIVPAKAAGREILLQAVVVDSCEISNLVVQKFE